MYNAVCEDIYIYIYILRETEHVKVCGNINWTLTPQGLNVMEDGSRYIVLLVCLSWLAYLYVFAIYSPLSVLCHSVYFHLAMLLYTIAYLFMSVKISL